MRNDRWLKEKLHAIWSDYYEDVPKKNDVVIRFSRRCRGRLGSIRLVDNSVSEIRINGILKDLSIPEYVCDAVVAHELTHYVHGFGSKRPRLYKYPHRGGIVAREMTSRGLGQTHNEAKDWINSNWLDLFDK
ncbi:MAG: hypothetical protein HY779_04415 [Rubrobacteridae bacterium]|nr:hypothetical protein [Rubrobacteridae bacterium]